MELRNARCLVTGASSGIGRALALALTRAGAVVAASGRDRAALDEVAAMCRHLRIAEFPDDAARVPGGLAVPADLAAADGPDRAATAALDALERVDVLVCNAGVGWAGPLVTMTAAEADQLIDVNFRAAVHLVRALLPPMIEHRRGHIMLVSSIAGHLGVGGEAVYSATKGALLSFADGLEAELAGSGIEVSVLAPGVVATAFFDRRNRPYDRRFPRPISAERVADAAVATIQRGGHSAIVPRWLTVPARLHGGLPGLYRSLSRAVGPSATNAGGEQQAGR